jgi:hypothetical protein
VGLTAGPCLQAIAGRRDIPRAWLVKLRRWWGALDLPAELGRATAIGLRVVGVPVPIATTPTRRWLFPAVGVARCIMS